MGRLLFLTSIGLPPKTRHFFLQELNKKPKDLKVAFIPTAADPEDNKWFVKAARDELVELGFQVEDVDLKINKDELRKKLEDCDIIYINGGNTFYLLEWIRRSGLDKYLGTLIKSGKPYIGGSAGSIIVGPNIELAGMDPDGDENINSLKDLSGLNIVPFAIFPHFIEKNGQLVKEIAKGIEYPIMWITNEQAVLVKDDDYKVVPGD